MPWEWRESEKKGVYAHDMELSANIWGVFLVMAAIENGFGVKSNF